MYNLTGKKVVVTGSAQGNGEAIALEFAKHGAIIVLADFNFEKLEKVKNKRLSKEKQDILQTLLKDQEPNLLKYLSF